MPMSDTQLAIIGMGCRFPGADSPHEFWRLLKSGQVLTGSAPAGRRGLRDKVMGPPQQPEANWSGAFLEDVFNFDCDYFGIAPREARAMDPQHRLILQTAALAIEDAALTTRQLASAVTGVFTGVAAHDFSILSWAATADHYSTLGTAHGLSANRVSYWLNARGPSLAVDTACSSALVALHYARLSLTSRECDYALCAAASVMLLPEVTSALQAAGIVSPSGTARPFDTGGDGYVRGEGGGAVLLCRLDDALAQGCRIYAVVRGSAVNHNGLSNGLSAPSPAAQAEVIRQAYAAAGVPPGNSRYVEAMGSAQPLADSMELKALQDSVGRERDSDKPCYIGTLKGHIGHLEAASGMAGLIKLALSLWHGELLPVAGLQQPIAYLARDQIRLQLVTQSMPLQGAPDQVAGVSAFGFGGANAHVVLGPAPVWQPPEQLGSSDQTDSADEHSLPPILTFSAGNEVALRHLAGAYQRLIKHHPASLSAICYSANISRGEWPWRAAVTATQPADFISHLSQLAEGAVTPGTARVTAAMPALVFTDEPADGLSELRQSDSRLAVVRDALKDLVAEQLTDFPPALRQGLLEATDSQVLATPPADNQLLDLLLWPLVMARLWSDWISGDMYLATSGKGVYAAAVWAGLFNLKEACELLAAHASGAGSAQRDNHRKIIARRFAVENAAGLKLGLSDRQREKLPAELLEREFWWQLADQDSHAIQALSLPPPAGTVAVPLNIGFELNGSGCGAGQAEALAEVMVELYQRGVVLNWSAIHRARRYQPVSLPGYPFAATVTAADSETALAVTSPQTGLNADAALQQRLEEALKRYGF